MQFITIIAALFAAAAVAAPAPESAGSQVAGSQNSGSQTYAPCSGVDGTAQCCATDALGVADLNCASPPSTPTSATNFSAVCSAMGQIARCCATPAQGQDAVCNTPVGVQN
ncbi:Cerato-ulmin hydrophobin family [Ustulina deusta]|nr:Cerato-ulmin hydrophobin family [Ustulina deusta]